MKRFKPISCICTNFKILSRISVKLYNKHLKKYNISCTQYAILINIHRYQPVFQHKVAQILSLDNASISRAVKILLRKGLITIQKGQIRNTKNLSLTQKGNNLTLNAKQDVDYIQRTILEKFGTEAWDELKISLDKLQSILTDLELNPFS